jgi:hypothetical protein
MHYSGRTKIDFCNRLGDSWQRLADFLEIPSSERDGFGRGYEGADKIWQWLKDREALDKLSDALAYIGRNDLVRLLEPEAIPATPTQARWSGSPYPGLLSFKPDDAPIFFGRDKEIRDLIERLKNPANRFLAVIGASGSGKSSLVAAGLTPRLGDITGDTPWLSALTHEFFVTSQ